MAIAHDTATRFPTTNGTTGVDSSDTTTGNRTFSHSGSASATAAVVMINANAQPTAVVSAVLYGGVNMALIASAVDTSEASACWLYVLEGNPIPQGTQTVTLVGCTATAKWVTCCTVTGTSPKVDGFNSKNTTTSANPQVNITNAATAMAYVMAGTGSNAPGTSAIAGCTLLHSQDYGTRGGNSARWTSPTAAGTTAIGITIASEDHCVVGVAFSEGTTPAVFPQIPHVQLDAA